MMRALQLAALLCLSAMPAVSTGQPPQALDDGELAGVSGADGVSFAMHLSLNDPNLSNPVADSRIALGFHNDGTTSYIVVRNLRGTIDMSGVGLDVRKQPDGSDYLALTLPSLLKFTNFGFESLSAQSDPLAPVTDSIGRFSVNGSISMQGQLRFWAH